MIFWSVARGLTAVCVQLTANYLDCSTDAVRLLWATETDELHESNEYVCGKWTSEKGESSIFWDSNMKCLSFEESVDDSGYLHGGLDMNRDGWQARLAFHDMDEDPCYSSSCGEEPEYVGDIHVRLLSETAIETQIKFDDDD